jgi:hypothetical protein
MTINETDFITASAAAVLSLSPRRRMKVAGVNF